MILAGVTVNFLIAFVLFYVVIAGQGRISEGPSTTINRIVANSAAADAGLKHGDRIAAVNSTPIHGWDQMKSIIEKNGGKSLDLTVERGQQVVHIEATPHRQAGQGFLGVAPETTFRSVGIFEAVPESFNTMGDVLTGTGAAFEHVPDVFKDLGNVSTPAPTSGPGSKESLERPRSIIGIVDVGSQIAGDVWGMLALLGLISFSLGLINLLPFLPFDGGHAAVVIYEGIASKLKHRTVRVDYRKLLPVTTVFMVLFGAFAISALLLDVRDAIGS